MDKNDNFNYLNSPLIGTSNLILGGGEYSLLNVSIDIFNEMESTNYYSNFTTNSW